MATRAAAIAATVFFGLSAGALQAAEPFMARLAEPEWDGIRIPPGQVCRKHGGTAAKSPALAVSGIPPQANVLVMEYSDRDYAGMDHGGHGKLGFALAGRYDSVLIPSVTPYSFELPAGFFTVNAHRNPNEAIAGAYMPPCSGGKGHAYYVTVRALRVRSGAVESLAEATVELGRY